MALSPALRKLVTKAAGPRQPTDEPARGIIPFYPVEIDPRDSLIYEVAEMISEAVTGHEIHAWELAEMIVDTVEEHHA